MLTSDEPPTMWSNLSTEEAVARGIAARKRLTGWATVWVWSARPDLWPPGRWCMVWSAEGGAINLPGLTWASWAENWAEVQQADMVHGPTEPGVAEAAILAGDIGTRGW